MLNLVYTLCSSAMFVRIVLGVRNRQVFCVWCFFARKHGLVQARRPHVTVVVLTLALLGRGGGGAQLEADLPWASPGALRGREEGQHHREDN